MHVMLTLSHSAYGFGTIFSKCPNTENIQKTNIRIHFIMTNGPSPDVLCEKKVHLNKSGKK